MKNQPTQAAATARPHFATPYLDKLATAADAALSAGTINQAEHSELMEGISQYTKKNPMLPHNCREIELRILANAPAKDTHTPFQFNYFDTTLDVRPIFDVLDISGPDGLASVIDSFINDLIRFTPTDDFTENFKNDLWHMRELRDAIMQAAGLPGLASWKRTISAETESSRHLLFDGKYLENRLN